MWQMPERREKATYDQLKEYKKNPKEFVNGVLNYVKNGAWNKALPVI